MSDDRTEWRAEKHPKFDVWRVCGDGMTISGLDKATAHDIAAVKEMKAALAYQTRVLAAFNASNLHSAGMKKAVERGMDALAKATPT